MHFEFTDAETLVILRGLGYITGKDKKTAAEIRMKILETVCQTHSSENIRDNTKQKENEA